MLMKQQEEGPDLRLEDLKPGDIFTIPAITKKGVVLMLLDTTGPVEGSFNRIGRGTVNVANGFTSFHGGKLYILRVDGCLRMS